MNSVMKGMAFFIALMLPTLAVSLGHKVFMHQSREAEPITGLSIMEAKGEAVDCSELGSAWSLAGPSFMMSPLMDSKNSAAPANVGLCIEKDPRAESVITDITFAVVHAEGKEVVNSLLSKVVLPSSPNATERMGVTKDAEGHCKSLGSEWALVQGRVAPVATSKMVHLCTQSVPRGLVGVEELILNIAPYTFGTAWQTSCASGIASRRFERMKVPAMDVEAFYENPLLLCIERRKEEPRSPFAFDEYQNNVALPTTAFPNMAFGVGTDAGNRSRSHIFVVGPETSGTRLWSQIMRDSSRLASVHGPNGEDPEWVYNNQAAVFHLSLPWGLVCGATASVPNYLDFGGTAEAYHRVSSATANVHVSPHAPRFNVQPLEVARQHHARGDPVTVLLIARDPRASLAGKIQGGHCSSNELAVAEQAQAYSLLLDAYRANDTNIHVICYEEMLAKGRSYVLEKLDEMALSAGDIPEIVNANEKYTLNDMECEGDMLAYGELCPNTELGMAIKSTCKIGKR